VLNGEETISEAIMNLKELQSNWNMFGKQDPLWAIATWPDKKGNRWELREFFDLGEKEIAGVLNHLTLLGVPVPRGRALDFGCGVGRLTQALAQHFDEVTGVDIAPSMINLANQYNRHGARCMYRLNEVDDLELFPSERFDFIYTNIVLQHMLPAYSKAYIREFIRVLKPGGVMVFQLPSERTARETRRTQGVPPAEAPPVAGALRGLKQMVKQVLPGSLLNWYVSFRYPKEPVMEMHCVERSEVEQLLTGSGAQVLHVVEDNYSGHGFRSFRYTVTKPIIGEHPN